MVQERINEYFISLNLTFALWTHVYGAVTWNDFCVTGPLWFPSQRAEMRNFDVFFDVCLKKRLNL